MKLLTLTCFLLAVLLHAVENVKYNRHVTLRPGVFNVSWYYNENNKRFYFKIQAKTTGWAALGLTTGDGKDMMNLDIALGGVRSGNPYLNDYATETRGEKKPELDGQQDYNLTRGSESGGMTVLEFNRLADTTDSIQDQILEDTKKITLCFAIDDKDATNSTTFIIHTQRKCSSMKYDMFPQSNMTTLQPTTAGHLVLPSLMTLVLAQAISIVY